MNLQKLKSTSVLVILQMMLLVAVSCSSNSDTPIITIVHTNDTHSQIDPKNLERGATGGVIERAAIIEMMRSKYPDLLYLDGGDMVQGSPYFNIWKGKIETKAMNLQGLNATTFGNHEFDNGICYLDSMLSIAEFPVLSCNYRCEGTAIERYVKPSMIIENQGVRIGLTGVTCSPFNLIFNRNWEGITYLDPIEAANKEAAALKQQGCDIVILLSHEGYARENTMGDKKIAAMSKDIDLIIGGHSHTNLEEGEVENNLEGRPVYITQTGGKHNPMGRIDIQMQRNGQRPDGTDAYELVSVTMSKLHPDSFDLSGYGQKMTEFITPIKNDLDKTMNQVIGSTDCTLNRFRPESPLGNFTSDALREICGRIYGKPIDVAVMNVGGLRNDIAQGDITLGDLYKVYPFDNTLAIIEISGEGLEQIVHCVEHKKLEAFSGITCTLVKNAEGKIRATDIRVNGRPIQPKKTYLVATIDYLAEGNDNMTPFLSAKQYTNTGVTIRDAMIDYVKQLTAQGKTVSAKIEGRIKEQY